MTTLFLDADSLAYSIAAAHQHEYKWSNDLWTYTGNMHGARISLREFVDECLKVTGCTDVRVALSDSESNFRTRVLPTYKMNRVGSLRPLLYKAMREEMQQNYGAVIEPHLEGDDLVSIWATAPRADGIICSIDKDLRTVPGRLYNPRKGEGVEEISGLEASRFFYSQILAGDPVDGYSGCPGLGEKRTAQLLEGFAEEIDPWRAYVVPSYEAAGLSEKVAIQNARCAHLLRWNEYHVEGGVQRIDLWHPRGEGGQLIIG